MLKFIMDRLFQRPKLLRDDVSQTVTDLLFPDLVEVEKDGDVFLTDYSVDSNLYAALLELEEGHNDEVIRETLRKCYEKLVQAREFLEAKQEIQKGARYLVVDTPK